MSHTSIVKSLLPRAELEPQEFAALKDLVESTLGISVPEHKRSMLETRILRRMRTLHMHSIGEYCRKLQHRSEGPPELQHFFDIVTTNKTSFFRELSQLELLANEFFPDLLRRAARERRELVVWSAASSTGQEVWTLCMMLDRVVRSHGLRADFVVLGSDVSTRVLEVAMAAKYPSSELAEVPEPYREYFLRSKDPGRKLVRVAPSLRQRAGFFRQNLMDDRYSLGRQQVDVALLRNALIYFPRELQHLVAERLCGTLRPDGLLAVGLTETLHGAPLPLRHLQQSIYALGAA
jgi:chemotaxis protein methyltransferase CheR